MPLHHIMILAIVQGISEFLPISSSGHLILTHTLLQRGSGAIDFWGTSLTMDIAVHVGTLLAVLIYFHKDVLMMALGGIDILKTRRIQTPGARLLMLLVASSIPVMIAGLVLSIFEPEWARSIQIVAVTLIVFGILLGIADKIGATERRISDLTLRDAMIVGAAQMLALIPGVSRSGITMTAARFLGFSRVEAARFSFFMAIIALSAAGALGVKDLIENPEPGLVMDFTLGIVFSCAAAMGTIHFLMKWLQQASFMVFVWYRIGLGTLLLVLLQMNLIG